MRLPIKKLKSADPDRQHDPFDDHGFFTNTEETEYQIEKLIRWVFSYTAPVMLVSVVLFFGSNTIAQNSQRPNARYTALEEIQIGSLFTARNSMILGCVSFFVWFQIKRLTR